MNFIDTGISGLIVAEPKVFKDERGYFLESFNRRTWGDRIPSHEFVQDNQSYSSYGTLRGFHIQLGEASQAKLVSVIEGEVLDVAVDLRDGSPSFGETYQIVLSGENKKQMYIPRGFGHAFLVLSDKALFTYKCDNYYAPDKDSGIHFLDPDLNIDWPVAEDKIILSDKDKQLGSLKGFKSGVKYE